MSALRRAAARRPGIVAPGAFARANAAPVVGQGKLLKVRGTAMAPAIKDGWFVSLETGQPLVLGDCVFVRTVDGRRLVRVLTRMDDATIMLSAYNTDDQIELGHDQIHAIVYCWPVPPSVAARGFHGPEGEPIVDDYRGRQCVLYMKDGREERSPWFTRHDRAVRARRLLAARYGATVLYLD